jgi:hypothetical protein
LNGAKKILLASAGLAALAGPVAIGVVIGIGHVPAIHAQSPKIVPAALQMDQSLLPANPAPAPMSAQAAPATQASQNNRLVAMLFDFSTMTPEDQSLARAAGVAYVQNSLTPADLVCVMLATTGQPQVVQDFTADTTLIRVTIQGLGGFAGNGPAPGFGSRVGNIEAAAKMLGALTQKKSLIYFSSGLTREGLAMDEQAALKLAVIAATQANVAIFPIDVRGAFAPAPDGDASAGSGRLGGIIGGLPAAASSGGRGGRESATPAQPAGVSQDEYNRRVAEAQEKFGSTSSATAHAYIRYGPPDQIDDRSANTQSPSQIWRYNYLPSFHSSTEFEFTQGKSGKGPLRMNINYPPPLATYSGTPATDTTLAEALNRENTGRGQPSGTNVTAGLPVRHTSMGVYPAGESSKLSVPLDSLSGIVDIMAQIKARSAAGLEEKVVGMLRDSVTLNGTSQSGMYQAEFTLEAGSYVGRVLVRDSATGRLFTEMINFDVK